MTSTRSSTLISGALTYTDQSLQPFIPYYYQAGTQLGWPTPHFKHLHPLLRWENTYQPRTYVPQRHPDVVRPDHDEGRRPWVRHHASHMAFIYGQNDPWGAEPFSVGAGSTDSKVYVSPGQNHSSHLIATLPAAEKAKVTADLLRWAGVSQQAKTLTSPQVTEDPMLAQRLPL